MVLSGKGLTMVGGSLPFLSCKPSAISCQHRQDFLKAQSTDRWDPEKRLWVVQYGKIAGTPLKKHIYVDEI
jgi:hypothetical protein